MNFNSPQNLRNQFIPVKQLLGSLFCFFSLIPWVNFGTNNMDSQPWSVIFAVGFIFSIIFNVRIPKYLIGISLVLVIGLLISVILSVSPSLFSLLRVSFGYFSIPIIFTAFYNYMKHYGFPFHLFVTVNFVWIFFGILELYYPEVCSSFSPTRTNFGRGVTSLAAEPTFFGIYLFFNSWIILAAKRFIISRSVGLILLINLLAVLFLAKSSMVILFYIVVSGSYFWYHFLRVGTRFSKKILFQTIIVILFLCISLVTSYNLLEGSRLYSLANKLLTNVSIVDLVRLDESVNGRVEALLFSSFGMVNNYFIPGGLETFSDTKAALISDHANGYFYVWVKGDKIMSWVGSHFYELGIFGIVALLLFYLFLCDGSRLSRINLITMFVILFSAIPIGFSLIPMLFAVLAFNKQVFLYNPKI